jgi:hypothetical protein
MKKVFLYLYPVAEYSRVFIFRDTFYESRGIEKPFQVLNECIEKRYREKEYEIVYAIYPDKNIHGLITKPVDRIITTDVTFKEASGYYDDGSEKPIEEVKYPSEEHLFNEIGQVDEIVIGGYHFSDCVKKVAEYFQEHGVKTLVDLELTDLFFRLYRQKYFDRSNYNPANFKEFIMSETMKYFEDPEKQFNQMYESSICHFSDYKPTVDRYNLAIEELKNKHK